MQHGFDDRWNASPHDPAPFVALLADLEPAWRTIALKALVPEPDGSRPRNVTSGPVGPVGWTDPQRATVLDGWLRQQPWSTQDEASQAAVQELLVQAVLAGRAPQVQVLLDHGVDLPGFDLTFTVPDQYGVTQAQDKDWTLLHLAAYRSHPQVVDLLLDRGVSIDALSRGGLSVLHALVLGLDEEDTPGAPEGWRACADRLLDAGADRWLHARAPVLMGQSVENLLGHVSGQDAWAPAWERLQLVRTANEVAPDVAIAPGTARPRL